MKQWLIKGISVIMIGMTMLWNHSFGTLAAVSVDEVGKPFICIVGQDYQTKLQYEGYHKIETNVNFFVVGKYYQIYQKNNDIKTVRKEIMVLDETTFRNNGYYFTHKEMLFGKNLPLGDIIKIIMLPMGDYIIAERYCYEKDGEVKQDLILTRYGEKSLLWRTTIKQGIIGNIYDLQLDGDVLVGLANIDCGNRGMDLYLFQLSLNGMLVKETVYGGSSYDSGRYLIISKGMYVIAGDTTSCDGDFYGARLGSDSFILKIDKYSFMIQDVLYFAKPKNDEVKGFVYFDHSFYLVQSYYDQVQNMVKTRIMKLNILGEILQEFIMNRAYGFECQQFIIGSDHQLYLLAETYSYLYRHNISEVFQINAALEVTLLDSYYYPGTANAIIDSFDIDGEGNVFLLYQLYDAGCMGYFYRCFKNQNTIFSLEQWTDQKQLGSFISGTNQDFWIINERQELIIQQHAWIQLPDYQGQVMLQDGVIPTQMVLLNNKPLSYQTDKSMLDYQPEAFGTYRLYYYYPTAAFIFAYHIDLEIPATCNVKENHVYDFPLKVVFNGIGRLNGKHVLSGFVIEEQGDYTLEIRGKENQQKLISFCVKDLSIYHQVVLPPLNDEAKLLLPASTQPAIHVEYISATETTNVSGKNLQLWLIIFPVGLAIICIYLFWKGKRKC